MPFCMSFGRVATGPPGGGGISLNVFQNGSRHTGISADGKSKIFLLKSIAFSIKLTEDEKTRMRIHYPFALIAKSDRRSGVKLSPMIFENRGTDANKKVNGRKRQLLPGRRAVDTGGRIWFVHVHAGNQHDGPAALHLSADILCQNQRLQKIYGDQAYNGVFARKMKEFGIEFIKASRPESAKGFVPVAKRWVVERTIAWTNFFRRIVKDYEYTISSSVAWIILANIQLMLQRISPINQI